MSPDVTVPGACVAPGLGWSTPIRALRMSERGILLHHLEKLKELLKVGSAGSTLRALCLRTAPIDHLLRGHECWRRCLATFGRVDRSLLLWCRRRRLHKARHWASERR